MNSDTLKGSTLFPEAVAELLPNGHSVRFSAPGNSMHPTIKKGDTLIIDPCDPEKLCVGEIALFKHDGRLFAHRIIRIESSNKAKTTEYRYIFRGDFRRHPDPPITVPQILGKVVSVERNRRRLSPYACGKRLFAGVYRMASQLKSQLPT